MPLLHPLYVAHRLGQHEPDAGGRLIQMSYSIITISRQYGSGGREIGTQLAERLGIPFYDRALCEEAAKRSGLDPTFLELAERREGRKLAYQFQFPGAPFRLSLDD